MPNSQYWISDDIEYIIDNYTNKYIIHYWYDNYFFNKKYTINELRDIKIKIKKIVYDLYFEINGHYNDYSEMIVNKGVIVELKRLLFSNNESYVYKAYTYIYFDVVDIIKCSTVYDSSIITLLIDFIDNNRYFNFNKYKQILYDDNYIHNANDDYLFGQINQYDSDSDYEYDSIIYNDNNIIL